MPDKTPHKLAAGFPFGWFRFAFPLRSSGSIVRFRSRLFLGFPGCASIPAYLVSIFSPAGAYGASQVPGTSLPACHGLWTPADLHHPRHYRMISCCLRITLNPRHPQPTPLSKLYQHFRRRGSPYGLRDSLSTLHLSCPPQSSPLRQRRKTRYGWMASPYPTGTFTLLDAPSFAWRET